MSANDVRGKAALITGGGSGINLAFAQLLLESGCSVIIGDLALQPEAQALVDKYTPPPPPPAPPSSSSPSSAPSPDSASSSSSSPPRALFHRTDVTSFPQLSSLFALAATTFPHTLTIVVAGAGVFEPPWASFWHPPRSATNPASPSRDDADAEPGAFAALGVNLVAPMRLAQLALAHWTRSGMITAGGGGAGGGNPSFIAVSSIAGHTASPTYPFYFASKHGLHGFIRSMGMLRDAVGVRFGAVAPGAVKTRIFDADPSKAALSAGTVSWIPAADVAAAMLRLVVDPALGDGTILEVLHSGSRVVPLFNADPPEALDQMLPALRGEVRLLAERLASGEFAV
ncbi:short chain dehydrogenase [Purpureocillium lilacinum]|uniref:Short chain dehydrogenase n=1 Tax=Purpureocillium lilacinum TaxID=33203 RepID=A0A179HXW9_PURLI|nr:short chain dehydrogenase [Purpureocillium lilacinum]OAQ86211.1 short chain dehydrogenase [Purpureocillium lilacinum]OAQ94173.1 short chain dehydrogenase [Purpureocillium lilacinum]